MKIKTTLLVFTFSMIFFFSVGKLYADGIVSIDQGGIKNIIRFNQGSDLRNNLLNLLDNVTRFVRLILNWVALLAMLYIGFLWVTSMGSEEKTSDGKNRIILVVLWLLLVNLPEAIYKIFTGSSYKTTGFRNKINDVGGNLSTAWGDKTIIDNSEQCNFLFCPQNFSWTDINSIITISEIAMVVTAVVMFTIWGFTMLLWWAESSSETAKKRITYGVIALVVTGFLEMIYRAIYFQSSLNMVATDLTSVLIKWAKFFIYMAGPIAIISIIIGGYYFITSGGDEERADKGKKILMYTFFATVMLLLGYTFLIEIIGLKLY